MWFGMDVNIRKYRSSDRPAVIECMERFGDYFVPLDPMRRTRRMPGYGEWSTDKMLEEVEKNQGVVFVVEDKDGIVGFIAGVMPEQSRESLLECVPSRVGRVIELYLEEEFRGKGIGTRLMGMMEEYFRQHNCDVSKVEVFAPNVKAHDFYGELRYQDRDIDMTKML